MTLNFESVNRPLHVLFHFHKKFIALDKDSVIIVHLSWYVSFWLSTYRDDENRYRTVIASLAKEIGKNLDQFKWQLIRL